MTEINELFVDLRDKYKGDEEQLGDLVVAETEKNDLEFWREYADLEGSQRIAKYLVDKIKMFNQTLVEQDEPIKRAELKGRRSECEQLLKRFTNDYDNLLKILEEDLKELI